MDISPYAAHPKGARDVWVDWSGYSAVAVCALCGWTDWAGMSAREGASSAAEHRRKHSELSSVVAYPYVLKPPCAWGSSYWGAGLGETCDKEPTRGEYCVTHASRVDRYNERGTCRLCFTVCMERQPLCQFHAYRWARQHGYLTTAVSKSGNVTIP